MYSVTDKHIVKLTLMMTKNTLSVDKQICWSRFVPRVRCFASKRGEWWGFQPFSPHHPLNMQRRQQRAQLRPLFLLGARNSYSLCAFRLRIIVSFETREHLYSRPSSTVFLTFYSLALNPCPFRSYELVSLLSKEYGASCRSDNLSVTSWAKPCLLPSSLIVLSQLIIDNAIS